VSRKTNRVKRGFFFIPEAKFKRLLSNLERGILTFCHLSSSLGVEKGRRKSKRDGKRMTRARTPREMSAGPTHCACYTGSFLISSPLRGWMDISS